MTKQLPPHNIESEEAVLGSMLIDPELTPHAAGILTASDFYVVKNGWIFDAIVSMHNLGQAIDSLTVSQELTRRDQYSQIGGDSFIAHLINCVPTSVHIVSYAEEVKVTSIRRRMIELGSNIAQHAWNESNHIEDALSEIQAGISAIRKIAAKNQGNVSVLTADDILHTDWPDPVWAIPGVLPTGLCMLAGKPKNGKSWLALQIACAISTGGVVFNQRVQQGPVLYMALEDYPKRLYKRLKKQQWPDNAPVEFITMKTFSTEIGDLAGAGLDRLQAKIKHNKYRLVVIDTFSRAIGMYMRVKEDASASIMTRVLSPIQELANEQDMAIIMIDHHTKATGLVEDAITDIMGSIAKGATMDTAWGLYRERGHSGAKLQIVGRDIEEETTLAMEFDREYGIWHCNGDSNSLEMTARRQEILLALQEMGRATNDQLSEMTGQDKGNTYKRLSDMVSVGLIIREVDGSRVYYKRSPSATAIM